MLARAGHTLLRSFAALVALSKRQEPGRTLLCASASSEFSAGIPEPGASCCGQGRIRRCALGFPTRISLNPDNPVRSNQTHFGAGRWGHSSSFPRRREPSPAPYQYIHVGLTSRGALGKCLSMHQGLPNSHLSKLREESVSSAPGSKPAKELTPPEPAHAP